MKSIEETHPSLKGKRNWLYLGDESSWIENDEYGGDGIWGPNEEGDIDSDNDIIEFIRGSFCVGDSPLHTCKLEEVEIIGNIYENPELLK